MDFTGLNAFKTLARENKSATVGAVVRKDMISTVADMDDRRVKFTISTNSVDRENDTIDQTGWQLDAFRANPVVLWSHDQRSLPIGRCIEIGNDGASLSAVVEFIPPDMPVQGPLAEAVFRMCRTGFLSSTSVGFRPTKFELATERMTEDTWLPPLNFLEQELMEFSICSIPCNAECLIDPSERRAPAPIVPPADATVLELSAEDIATKDAEEALQRDQQIARLARASRQRQARLLAVA